MKLKNEQLEQIFFSLKQLDQPTEFDPVTKSERNLPRFKFTEKANYAIGKNLRKLQPLVQEVIDDRRALATTYNPESLPQPVFMAQHPEKWKEWQDKHDEIMKTEREDYQPHTFKYSGLNIASNHGISQAILMALVDVVIEDDFKDPDDGK